VQANHFGGDDIDGKAPPEMNDHSSMTRARSRTAIGFVGRDALPHIIQRYINRSQLA
jgi:hypothetical protein